jgi:hypothetical protein
MLLLTQTEKYSMRKMISNRLDLKGKKKKGTEKNGVAKVQT